MTNEPADSEFAFATNRVTEEGRPVLFMYRESPDHPRDSGWRFFSGDESQEYVDDPDNSGIVALSAIVEADPSIVPYLETPAPCAFERENEHVFQGREFSTRLRIPHGSDDSPACRLKPER